MSWDDYGNDLCANAGYLFIPLELLMKVNITRYYKREQLKLDCEIITPMFLGNANQEAELRAAPFKGLLRYWWRVANGLRHQSPAALLQAENRIFGSADADSGGKSRVTVEVEPLTSMAPKKDSFRQVGKIDHPECERTGKKTDPLNYLAGMGLIHFRKGIVHSYFPADEKFCLTLTMSSDVIDYMKSTFFLLNRFGAIGSRCRNGWGCFTFPGQGRYTAPVVNFSEAFIHDYPYCLGKDDCGDLFWQTRQARDSWELCMKDLAGIYVSIRAGNSSLNMPALEVNAGTRPDRHLLGYPVTNHPLKLNNWGSTGRHGSALRLLVRKEADGYRGYFLHLPHLFSKEMWPGEKDRQINIWKQVHAKLDQLCQRVAYQEAGE